MKRPVVPAAELNWPDGKVSPLRKLHGDQPAHERCIDMGPIGLHVYSFPTPRFLVKVPRKDTLNRFQNSLAFFSATRSGLSADHFLSVLQNRLAPNPRSGHRPRFC